MKTAIKVEGFAFVYSSSRTICPVCKAEVPARTPHRCLTRDGETKEVNARTLARAIGRT